VKLADTSLKLAELDPCFKECAQLERKVSKLNNYNLSPHERAHIPTDFPDVVSLSSLTHVLALVGPFARYNAQEISQVKRLVKEELASKVTAFKAMGDLVNARKDFYKAKKPVDMDDTRRLAQTMREGAAEIEDLTTQVKELVLRLREEKKGFRPESLPSVERKTFGKDGAEWFVGPIEAYLEELRLSQGEKSIKGFTKWCKVQVQGDDERVRRAVVSMAVHMGAFNDSSGLLDGKLIEVRVKEYLKHFKSSLPSECILR